MNSNNNPIHVNITAANIALLLLFGSACVHSFAKYFYFQYRLVFGTLFPAYSSYKAIKYKDVKQYSRWMMYWIVFAIFSFVEVFADIFIGFWLPFYYEMKILFVLWLMSPYGNGSKILYLHLIHPQLTSHEETIDLYIDSAKQLGITSVMHLWTKVTEFGNKSLIYLFQIIQTLVFHQIQQNGTSSIDGPRIQNQQLLSEPNFLQQLLFRRSPKPNEVQPMSEEALNSSPSRTVNPISQRWFSEEALNIIEVNDEFIPSPQISHLRMRSESESNLDDWEQMDANEVYGKPPVQPSKARKKKTIKSSAVSDKPVRRTARVAALKARAKCKEEECFPEEY